MGFHRKYKPKKHCNVKPDGCIELCHMSDVPVETLRSFYCAGEILPLKAVGTVTVCCDDQTQKQLKAGDPIPQNVNGFVMLDKDNMKMKFVAGKQPQVDDPVIPEAIQETFCPGETLPEWMKGKVDACLVDGTPICLASTDPIPHDLDGVIQIDEVTGKGNFDQDSVKPPTDDHITALAKTVAQACIDALPDDQVRTDGEILSLAKIAAQACIDANGDEVRSDAEIEALAKQVAQACIDALPDDQVRTDVEIQILAKAVVEACLADLPPDQVRSDAEIKTIAQNCFALLAADFLTASEIYSYIDAEINDLPPHVDTDTVRPDSEIIALASQVVKECLADYDDQTRSDLEIEAIAKQAFTACIALLPPDTVRTEAEIIGIASQVVKDCIADLDDDVRSNEEIEGIAKGVFTDCIALLPPDTVRSDLEIKALAKEVFLECAELLTVDDNGEPVVPRTDAEIQVLAKAVAQACINANPDQVRSDTEIKAIVNACIALLPPDEVRSDAEIEALAKAVAEQCIALLPGPRTDAEIILLIEQYIEAQPGDWTQTQIETIAKAVAQACIDSNPDIDTVRSDAEIQAIAKIIAQQCIDDNGDQVRTDAEIEVIAKAMAELCIANLPPDQVRSDTEIKAIVEACLAELELVDTFGVPGEATQAGTDIYGKVYEIGDPITTYPNNLVVCTKDKLQPQVVRVSDSPASILACLADCQFVYNCNTNVWFQFVNGSLLTVPAADIPPVALFIGDLKGCEFACKYEAAGNVYCHNYHEIYVHEDHCVVMCTANATQISFPYNVVTGDGSGFTIDWGDGTVETYQSGDQPSHDYANPFTGKIEVCFDKCAISHNLLAEAATGSFTYLTTNCGC